MSTAFLFLNVAFFLETARNLFCVGLFCLKINHSIKVYLIFGIEVFCKSGYILYNEIIDYGTELNITFLLKEYHFIYSNINRKLTS